MQFSLVLLVVEIVHVAWRDKLMGEFVHENDVALIIPISLRTDLLTCAIMMMNLRASCGLLSPQMLSLINSALRVAISAIVCEFHFFLP